MEYTLSLMPEERERMVVLVTYSETDLEILKAIRGFDLYGRSGKLTEEQSKLYYTIEGIEDQIKKATTPQCLVYYAEVVDGKAVMRKTATSLKVDVKQPSVRTCQLPNR